MAVRCKYENCKHNESGYCDQNVIEIGDIEMTVKLPDGNELMLDVLSPTCLSYEEESHGDN